MAYGTRRFNAAFTRALQYYFFLFFFILDIYFILFNYSFCHLINDSRPRSSILRVFIIFLIFFFLYLFIFHSLFSRDLFILSHFMLVVCHLIIFRPPSVLYFKSHSSIYHLLFLYQLYLSFIHYSHKTFIFSNYILVVHFMYCIWFWILAPWSRGLEPCDVICRTGSIPSGEEFSVIVWDWWQHSILSNLDSY